MDTIAAKCIRRSTRAIKKVEISVAEIKQIQARLRQYEAVANRRLKLATTPKLKDRSRGRRDAFRSARKLLAGVFLAADIAKLQ